MVAALLKFAQGALTAPGGQALAVVAGGPDPVVITNTVDTDVASWRIELLYGPPGSSFERDPGDPLVLAEQANDPTPTHSLTTDTGFDGECYRIRLTVWDGPNYTGNSDVDIRDFGVPRGALLAIFPPNQIDPLPLYNKPNELNFGAQQFHWSGHTFAIAGVRLVNALLAALVDEAGGNVDSVFGRTGTVIAEAGDYAASQVTNDSSVTGTYVDDALDTLDSGKVDQTTSLTAGAGLTGGGDLSTNRTFDVGANPDGSIVVNADDIQVGVLATDAQHGNRGGGALHAIATAVVAGFMSAAMFTKLDGIETGAQVNTVTSVFSRTGDVVAADHDYDSDQVDNASTVSGSSVSDALETLDGDIQAHIGAGGSSEHPDATTSVSGFMSTADKTKLDGIASGAVSDHGALSGLGDDDHTQYILASGTRGFSGVVEGQTPTASAHLATKGYVDGLVQGLDWRPSVLDQVTAPLGGETGGERYLVIATATGAFVGHEDDIAEYNGSSWDFYTPDDGWAVWVEDVDQLWVYNGLAWVRFGSTVDHGNLIGLGDDDHTQYLLVSGTRAMSGALNMGGNAITSVGNVDGRDVSADGATLDAHVVNYSNPHAVTTTQIGAVPTTTQVIAGNGLTGGGALSSNVTLNVSYGSAPADVYPGQTQGAGASNNVARIDHTHANYPWRSANPATVDAGLPTPGTDPTYARGDHRHSVSVGSGASSVDASVGGGGAADSLSRSDHTHQVLVAAPVGLSAGGSNVAGTADTLARSDHEHAMPVGIAYTLGEANSIGSASTFSRSDHVHSHGSRSGGNLHALANAGVSAGFISADDQTKLDSLSDGTAYVLLAGRSTGQLIHGGTGASEDLVLRGTSHATPGVVQLDSSNFDLNGNQVVNGANHIIGYQAGNLDVGNDSYAIDINGSTVSLQTGGIDRVEITSGSVTVNVVAVSFGGSVNAPWFNQTVTPDASGIENLRVQAQSSSSGSATEPGGDLELAPGYSSNGVGAVDFLRPTGTSQSSVLKWLSLSASEPASTTLTAGQDVYLNAAPGADGTFIISTYASTGGLVGGGIIVRSRGGLGSSADVVTASGNASVNSGNVIEWIGGAGSTPGHWLVQGGSSPTEWARIGIASGNPFFSIGASPATDGTMRTETGFSLWSKDNSGTSYRIFDFNGSVTDQLRIGNAVGVDSIAFQVDDAGSNNYSFYFSGTTALRIGYDGNSYWRGVRYIAFGSEYNATGGGTTHTVDYTNGLKQYVLVDTGDTIQFAEPGSPTTTLFNLMLRIHNNTAMSALTFDSSGSANVVAASGAIDIAGGDEEETTLGVYWDGTQWHLTSSPNESHTGGAPTVNFV